MDAEQSRPLGALRSAAFPVGVATATARAPGDYAVTYHVVLDDGSNVVGGLRFSSGTGIPPALAGAPAGLGAEAGHAHGIDPLGATLLVADLVVVVVVGGLLLRRRPE